MLMPGKPAADDPIHLGTEVLIPIFVALYGVRPADILPETVTSVIMWLQGKNITVSDIQASFRDVKIKKKEYLLLSRDEILEPIRNYWNKKTALLNEIKSLQNEIDIQAAESARKSEELNTAIALFYECWKNRNWTGDEYQAKIVRNLEQFSELDSRIGKLFWKHSITEEYIRRQADPKKPLKELINTIIPSGKEFIFSQKWATYICKNRITITLFESPVSR